MLVLIKRFLTSVWLKLAILALALTYLLWVLHHQQASLQEALLLYREQLLLYWPLSILILLLSACNWSLEALKWRALAESVQGISFSHALRSVLSGLSLGFVSPHAVGDYAARIWHLQHTDRYRAVGLIFLGRGMQLLPTLLGGAYGMWVYIGVQGWPFFEYQLSLRVLLFMLLLSSLVLAWRFYSPIRAFIIYYFGLVQSISGRTVAYMALFSFLRYLVFILQFSLLFYLVDFPLQWSLILAGITWIFLIKSVLPAFNFFSDLGLREFSAVVFFSAFDVPLSIVVAASLMLWIVNILLPAIFGLFFLKDVKIFRT
jgi:hypothetical protein